MDEQLLNNLKQLYPKIDSDILHEIIKVCNNDLDKCLDKLKELEKDLTPPKAICSIPPKALSNEEEAFRQLKDVFAELDDQELIRVLKKFDYSIERSSNYLLEGSQRENSPAPFIENSPQSPFQQNSQENPFQQNPFQQSPLQQNPFQQNSQENPFQQNPFQQSPLQQNSQENPFQQNPFKQNPFQQNSQENLFQQNPHLFQNSKENDMNDLYSAFDFILEDPSNPKDEQNGGLISFDDYFNPEKNPDFESIELATRLVEMDKELEERKKRREEEDLKFALELAQNEKGRPLKLSKDEELARTLQEEFKSEEYAKHLEKSFKLEDESERLAHQLQEEEKKAKERQLQEEMQSEEYAKKLFQEELSQKNPKPVLQGKDTLRQSEEHPLRQLDDTVFDKEQRALLRTEILTMINNQLQKFNFPKIFKTEVMIQKVMTENLARRFEDQFLAFKLKYNYDPNFTDIELAFHGTPAKNVDSILEKGLLVPQTGLGKNIKHTTDSGWYGKGIYLSPDPQYCQGYAQNSGKLLVCAVLMGKRYKCKNNKEVNGKPVKQGYDSHTSPDSKEYVLFLAGQVYPCFVLCFGKQARQGKGTWFG